MCHMQFTMSHYEVMCQPAVSPVTNLDILNSVILIMDVVLATVATCTKTVFSMQKESASLVPNRNSYDAISVPVFPCT